MSLTLKVSNWKMDNQNNHQAILYIKDTDDNLTISRLMATPQPIAEVVCINNLVQTRTFYMVGFTQIMPDTMDGDFNTHPVKIVFETYK